MLLDICDKSKCTACGACINICPKKCIRYVRDDDRVKYAQRETEKCIECNLCMKTCPSNRNIEKNVPLKCYAAWSNDNIIRRNSASGGIAAEFYKYAIENGYWIVGVTVNENFEAIYSITKEGWRQFQNSKYIYSNMGDMYHVISDKLKRREKVLYIGLPCQVAALKMFLSAKSVEDRNLFTIDLICHGITPEDYLKEHIEQIEYKTGKRAEEVFFRDPEFHTYKYMFTLKYRGKIFYKRKVDRNDAYQIAYHRGIAYRGNCYSCQFAESRRVGDITLSDFTGVGSKKTCHYTSENVSCVMVNSNKGRNFYNDLLSTGRLFSEERPMEEQVDSQITMQRPIPMPLERTKFLQAYKESGDFSRSVHFAAKKIIFFNEINHITRIRDIRILIFRMIPKSMKDKTKDKMRKIISLLYHK